METQCAMLSHVCSFTWNDAVKGGAGVAESLFTSAESAKVFCRLGNHIGPEFHDNAASRLAANGNIEINLWVGPEE